MCNDLMSRLTSERLMHISYADHCPMERLKTTRLAKSC